MEEEGGGRAGVEGGQAGRWREGDRKEGGCRAEEGRLGLEGKTQEGAWREWNVNLTYVCIYKSGPDEMMKTR